MNAHTQEDIERLNRAARNAIENWSTKEADLSNALQSRCRITEEFMRRWLGYWMLARANPREYREKLVHSLDGFVRPRLLQADNASLPGLVGTLASELLEVGATKGLQTSLVSKFAFSCKPEVIVPYDRRARIGLRKMLGRRIRDHDYPAYLAAFHEFGVKVAASLDANGVTEQLRPNWEQSMSEKLFKLRAADKYLMLVGGFNPERMAHD